VTAIEVIAGPDVTSDPFVAVFYGLMAYPSQRPALTTTVDLVAGRTAPWILSDSSRAVDAEMLVARLGGDPGVIAACRLAHAGLVHLRVSRRSLPPQEVHRLEIGRASCRERV